jgi:hypothetical protein
MHQYTYSTVGTLTWAYDEYSVTVSVSNLSSLCVQMYVYGDAALETGDEVISSIHPDEVYVTVTH